MDLNQYAAYVARYNISKIAKIRLPWSLKDRGHTGECASSDKTSTYCCPHCLERRWRGLIAVVLTCLRNQRYASQEGKGHKKKKKGKKKKSSSEHKSVGGGWVTLPLRRGKPFVCMKVVVGGTT